MFGVIRVRSYSGSNKAHVQNETDTRFRIPGIYMYKPKHSSCSFMHYAWHMFE